ncbi:hypothetical protein B0H14DRAFT_2594895 [Mycena olivaceomarginata]|nr:hypothetical protein B0H14DRAFT_2594895 [Mycena olivaceomarginata]
MSKAEKLFPCSGCSKLKASDKFKIKNGTRARTCLECQSQTRGAKKANKENLAPSADLEEEQEPGSDLNVLPLEEFLDALTRQDDNLQLEARVDMTISVDADKKYAAISQLSSLQASCQCHWKATTQILDRDRAQAHTTFVSASSIGTSRSSTEEIQRQFFPSFDGHESDDEEQRAQELEQAAAILRSQVPHGNKLWLSSIYKRDVGADVSQMVADIRRFESTSRVRDTTWPKTGDKEARRRMQNTMGYQIPLQEE